MKDTDTLTITVQTPVTVQRIKDLLCNAIEGGSNYWVDTMDRKGDVSIKDAPYRQDVPFAGGWLELVDYDGKKHTIDLPAIQKGLEVFAKNHHQHFTDLINENDDADTGDVFLQCICFGEIVYG